ncbi:unnamed protein product [Nippostrongylus brasiliensis]|uniref:Chemotaxis protein n=1 Tax=Nippostrongylus brasiliensis TaxID=27835 RepID=A0A0N4Y1E9_NIPBR|nr:unnamed protein product [Nippostrongylus brasiliensis]
MSARIATFKRLLTHYCQKLNGVVSAYNAQQETDRTDKDVTADGKEDQQNLQELLGILESYTSKIEQLWKDYADALDKAENGQSEAEKQDFDRYSGNAEATLSSAFDLTAVLQGRLRSLTSGKGAHYDDHQPRASRSAQPDIFSETKRIELPAIPIPTFTGNR